MRTTLTLDEDVAARLRAEMRRSGKSFKETVNECLRQGLATHRLVKPARRFAVRARALRPRPGVTFDNIGELLDAADNESRR